MSKLGDRIRKANRVTPAPLGFAAAAAAPVAPSMLVLVRLEKANRAGKAIENGADVVIIEGDAGTLRDVKAPDGAIVGVVAGRAGRPEAAALREAGADFLVIDESTPAEVLLDDKLGFVMVAPVEMEDTRLRQLGDLSLEALLVESPTMPLTVASVLTLRRLCGFARAPMIARVDAGVDAGVLQVLRDSGCAGVVVGEDAIDRLAPLRERIAGIPVRGRKREEQASEALVPAMASGHDHGDYDDDDD